MLSTVWQASKKRRVCVDRQTASASGVVENLLDSVRQFGFVPNGARIYYLDRWKHVELKGEGRPRSMKGMSRHPVEKRTSL